MEWKAFVSETLSSVSFCSRFCICMRMTAPVYIYCRSPFWLPFRGRLVFFNLGVCMSGRGEWMDGKDGNSRRSNGVLWESDAIMSFLPTVGLGVL